MTFSNENPTNSESLPFAWKDVSNTLVSLATIPFLVGLTGGKTLAEGLQTLGLWSEEMFRGDRLPILDLSQVASPPSDNESV